MNSTIFSNTGVFSSPSLLLADSAVKGAALLMMAIAIVALLRWDSAATRHLVWLLTMVTLVAVPVLSALLPQWRVLPVWASMAPAPTVVVSNPPSFARPVVDAAHLAHNARPDEVESSTATAIQPVAVLSDAAPSSITPDAPAPAVWSWTWLTVLPLVWAMGFCMLMLRLIAVRWMLWNSERQATILASSSQLPRSTGDPLLRALDAACRQLAIAHPVTLLLHPDKTIPMVWGVIRWRLLLPATARNWSGEQLRSVLLHELAHIKRRDAVAQLITQLACALHWLNPLVWLAAWRLGVERERACDDVVLASGVRPSDYAGHLLDVVTGLSPVGWTQSCGLAMARQSSLEGRLALVLSKNLNRRRVSAALAAGAFAIAAGIAVPIAMCGAMDQRPGEKEEPAAKKDQKTGEEKPAPPRQQPAKSDQERMIGNWFITNVESMRKGEMWVISEGNILMRAKSLGLNANAYMHRLDATKDPKQIDINVVLFNGPPIGVIKGIYALEGDELRLRLGDVGKDRPAAFAKKPGPGELLILHRRPAAEQPKAKEEQPAANMQPRNEKAQWLFARWQNHARTDGKIPGALIGQLTGEIDAFLKQSPQDENAPRLAALRPRLDHSRDWTQAEVVALLDDIASISQAPVSWRELTMNLAEMRNFKQGQPLPAELKTAAWGAAEANGLRAAMLLEPVAKEYALGTVLKARVLFHNTGKEPVVFAIETYRQWDQHKARDANGVEIKVSRSFNTGLTPKATYRLAPGEYCEVKGQSIGIGTSGAAIPAKAGDEITLSHSVDATFAARLSDPEVWKTGIAARVEREGPMPKAAADREQLIRRVTLDVFGVPASKEEIVAFVGDNAADALAKLTERLQAKPRIEPWAGRLPTGETTFRVTAADK